MDRTNRFTKEELKIAESKNYNFVTETAQKLQFIKGYEVGYGNPQKGKMIINLNGENFLVDVEPIRDGTLDEVMDEYGYIFK